MAGNGGSVSVSQRLAVRTELPVGILQPSLVTVRGRPLGAGSRIALAHECGELVVLAGDSARTPSGARHARLEALAVVLAAPRLLASAASTRSRVGGSVGWRGEVHLGLDQVEELVALLVRDAILAMRALAVLVAEEACAEAVAVQLEAA